MDSELGVAKVTDLLREEMAVGEEISIGDEMAVTSTTPAIARIWRRLERTQQQVQSRRAAGESAERRWQLALDAASLIVGAGSMRLASLVLEKPTPPVIWDVFFFALVLTGFGLRGFYGSRIRPNLLDDARTIISATAVATMGVISARVILTDDIHLASQTAFLWVMSVGSLTAGRAGLFYGRVRAIGRGHGKPTLIVGAGKVGSLVARRLTQRPEFGLRPVGFLDNNPLEIEDERKPVPVLGASWNLEELIAEHGVEHVIFTFSTAPHGVVLGMVRRCQDLGVATSLVPRLFEASVERVSVEHLGGLPLFAMRPANPRGWQFTIKYAIDRIVAAFLLLAISPLMLALALAAKISMGGPIFFRQRRVGLDGREFEILKFRTMKDMAHCLNGSRNGHANEFPLPDDTAPGGVEGEDRRTHVGRFLRQTSLDELPQLINVLRGEMSIVGPRPERPEFVAVFGQDVHRYTERHRVKSGITGWAQIHGLRGQTSISDRAEWDNYYIENWSLWLDFKIALMTIPCLLMGQGE
jgi:exopolysaccharide biosynthesis polyprenyl glycosylphosphotransferase